MLWLMLFCVLGCSSSQWARMRRIPRNPLTSVLSLDSRRGPQPTARTLQMLRRYDLLKLMEEDPERVVNETQQISTFEPSADHVYAVAELAYIGARKREELGQDCLALDLYETAVANAHAYLFDPVLSVGRSSYDPRFRGACDLYNASLESTLRFLRKQGSLRPGGAHRVRTPRQLIDLTVASRGTWHEGHFQDLHFVSDFDVEELRNHYVTYGLGVPMIAVYRPSDPPTTEDSLYPPGMSFPVTAFLRVIHTNDGPEGQHHRCVVELHDTTVDSRIEVEGQTVPLEVDLTTPLAVSLDNPTFKRANQPVRGLRDAEESASVSGLYLLEPYHPDKIPVVMVHGFWSSIVTWMEMFNDLRGSADIRNRFQFWFYLYPSGQPYWYSAAHLRQQLAQARQKLDPLGKHPSLDQMVLVGHSAGGLVAELQTLESGDAFWKLVSHHPIDQLEIDPQDQARLQKTFFFKPDKSVRRVVSIATPHRGSNFSNSTTQWIGKRLIELPKQVLDLTGTLRKDHESYFSSDSLLNVTTNVDALAPDSTFLAAMQRARRAPWVSYHNVIGHVSDKKLLAAVANDSDGVVTIESARLPNAVSELVVDAPHASVHRHPRAVLEVKRILQEHLLMLDSRLRIPPPPLVIHEPR